MEALTRTRAEHAQAKHIARGWLALLRVPNLFTVPGDVVAGFLLARPSAGAGELLSLALLIAPSLCLYAAGLVLNDWWDIDRDRIERPERPLASGQVAPSMALAVSIILMLLALCLAAVVGTGALVAAAALSALVLFYNGAARRVPMLGFLTMGLCRGANLLLGASLALPDLLIVVATAAAVETLYIAAVTAAASRETEGMPRGPSRWAPAGVIAAGLGLFVLHSGASLPSVMGAALASGSVLWVAVSMRADLSASEAPRKIGSLVRCLIPIQAAFILVGGPWAFVPAALVYSLWPASWLAGRRHHGS